MGHLSSFAVMTFGLAGSPSYNVRSEVLCFVWHKKTLCFTPRVRLHPMLRACGMHLQRCCCLPFQSCGPACSVSTPNSRSCMCCTVSSCPSSHAFTWTVTSAGNLLKIPHVAHLSISAVILSGVLPRGLLLWPLPLPAVSAMGGEEHTTTLLLWTTDLYAAWRKCPCLPFSGLFQL